MLRETEESSGVVAKGGGDCEGQGMTSLQSWFQKVPSWLVTVLVAVVTACATWIGGVQNLKYQSATNTNKLEDIRQMVVDLRNQQTTYVTDRELADRQEVFSSRLDNMRGWIEYNRRRIEIIEGRNNTGFNYPVPLDKDWWMLAKVDKL